MINTTNACMERCFLQLRGRWAWKCNQNHLGNSENPPFGYPILSIKVLASKNLINSSFHINYTIIPFSISTLKYYSLPRPRKEAFLANFLACTDLSFDKGAIQVQVQQVMIFAVMTLVHALTTYLWRSSDCISFSTNLDLYLLFT